PFAASEDRNAGPTAMPSVASRKRWPSATSVDRNIDKARLRLAGKSGAGRPAACEDRNYRDQLQPGSLLGRAGRPLPARIATTTPPTMSPPATSQRWPSAASEDRNTTAVTATVQWAGSAGRPATEDRNNLGIEGILLLGGSADRPRSARIATRT